MCPTWGLGFGKLEFQRLFFKNASIILNWQYGRNGGERAEPISNFGGPTHGLPHLFHYLARPGAVGGGGKKKKRGDGEKKKREN